MVRLILGDEALPLLTELSSSLRRKTVERVSSLDGYEYQHYVPWLCIRPTLDAPIVDQSLLEQAYTPGELVTHQQYLQKVADFMLGQGAALVEGLPGKPEDWQILVDISTSRPGVEHAFHEAKSLITDSSHFFKEAYECLVDMVIPLSRTKSSGYGSHLARGIIFRAFPPEHSSTSVAFDLVHEVGHQALMLLQSVDPLLASDQDAPVFSEIRLTDRPAIQSFHAAAALAYMLYFSREANLDGFVDDRLRDYGGTLVQSLTKAVRSLRKACKFTVIGALVMDEFTQLAEECS